MKWRVLFLCLLLMLCLSGCQREEALPIERNPVETVEYFFRCLNERDVEQLNKITNQADRFDWMSEEDVYEIEVYSCAERSLEQLEYQDDWFESEPYAITQVDVSFQVIAEEPVGGFDLDLIYHWCFTLEKTSSESGWAIIMWGT